MQSEMFIFHAWNATSDRKQVGGKAGTLADLAQQNFPVPDWLVLTPGAFDRSLTEAQRQLLTTGNIPAALETLQLDQTLQTELSIALKKLCPDGEQVAVRSSAIDEDGTQHSFAGQLESFLNVPLTEVTEKVVEVWKSGFSDRLLAYRQEHHLAPIPLAPAVLIQKMVSADAAGVAFSANPVTGQRGVAVISAVRGLGARLVSGECDADTYQVDRTGQVLQQQQVGHEPILMDEQVQSIADLARRIEHYWGRPQDIEWAIEQGQLYLLQARPITALAQLSDPDGMLNLWDNSNIAESYGGTTTPLTFSFARRAYESVYREFCRMMGVSEAVITHHDDTFRRMLGLVRGRIYYNLLNWYRVLALLPGFTMNRRFMEQMMGVQEELPADVLATLEQANWHDKLWDTLRLGKTLLGLVRNYLTLPQQIQQFYQRLDRALCLPHAELEVMRPDELATYYHRLEQQLLTRWDAPLVNDFFAMIFYGVLRKLTVKWCNDSAETLQNDLISGEGGMISAEPAQRVRQMAQLIADRPDFIQLLREGSLGQILQQMKALPTFEAHYQTYLDRFGDRCLEELKLESTTLHDDPLLLLRSIGQIALAQAEGRGQRAEGKRQSGFPIPPSSHPPLFSSLTPNTRQKAEQLVQQSLKSHLIRQIIFHWVLKNARARVRDRENLRFERTRVFGRVRRVMLELGKRFYALDALTAPRDIFYLELSEILGFIDGTATCTDLKGLVALRRAEFTDYQNLPAPADRFSTLGTVHPFIPSLSPPSPTPGTRHPAPDTLQGIGCCPGIVRAPVQVITDPQNACLQPGSILVAERTDPGWIMLFSAAAGLLVERGSLLSHSAIVAREMGIPAIVSIADVTQWLKSGDWVEMDGSTGLIRKIENASSSELSDALDKISNLQ